VRDHDAIYARAYARALYRSAVERLELADAVADMKALDAQWRGSAELRRFCKMHHSGNTRSHELLVDGLWGKSFTAPVLVMLRTLSHREQLEIIPLVIDQFMIRYDREQHCSHVALAFALQPTEATLEQIRERVAEARGPLMRMQVKVDADLIAGFMITLDDQRIDASMAGRVKRLRMGLKNPGMAV
jgi:F-type H+-transporting ATPase subunit delta